MLGWQRGGRAPRARRSWRQPSTVCGLALLLLGLLLTIWRLRIDLTADHALHAARHVSRMHANPAAPAASVGRGGQMGALPAALPVAGAPSLGAPLVNAILVAYHSPLRAEGARIVALSRRYRIDDAVALAFFVMESRAGTQGEAVLTHSPGNLRPMPNAAARDGYRSYATWTAGTDEWFRMLRSFYLDTLKLSTVEAVVPVYAPAWDNNDPVNMIAGIRQLVSCWRGALASCPDDPPGIPALVARAWGLALAVPTATAITVADPRLHP